MADPNWKNRTMWTGDNLDIMRGMNSESVDLIYLDPPFNSNEDYSAPVGSEAAGAAFKDTWTLSDVDEAWHGEIADKEPALYAIIDAAGLGHGKSMKSYLIMMAVRLLEMRRLLKPTGSIYLHCDPTAGHYLKMTMDCVFGRANFRNAIIWRRTNAKGLAFARYASNYDNILYYGMGEKPHWNPPYGPYDPAYVDAKYRQIEPETGRRYMLDNLLNPNKNRPNLTYEFLGVTRVWRWTQERMQAAYEKGLVVQPRPGAVPRLKRYLDEQKGQPIDDVWNDIPPLNSQAKERTGYPTQKPLVLLSRIIKASSNPGDMILDPFAGCATACVAAERLKRQWIGIDLSSVAAALVVSRLRDEGSLLFPTHSRADIPRRTDLGKLPSYKTHKHQLFGKQEGICAGCQIAFPFRNMTIDHIVPQSKGGTDHIDNLQLLCGACNSLKGDREQARFLADLKERGIVRAG
ncbi:MAG: DNA methyltransferase [Desulfurellaceae bacterium]|nr:DNA methyltransferase [Desulfurellaceae bacterium]